MPLFRRKPVHVSAGTGTVDATEPVSVSASRPTGDLESRIAQIGGDLLRRARGHKAGILSARFYSDKMMDWSMRDQAFKVQLFRFVDCFPTLTTSEMVHDHLVDYLTQPGVKAPPGMDLGLRVGGVAKGLAAATISRQIRQMAEKFIAGTDARSALPGLRKLWEGGTCFSVDLLGEACVSDAEADAYRDKYLDLVTNLPGAVSGWKPMPVLERDHWGAIPRVNVSVKISSLSARCDPIDPEGSIGDLMRRLVPILEAARARGVFVNFDMEQHSLKDLTIDLFMRCCERVDFEAGLAMQAYLRSGVEDARRLAEWAKRTGRTVTVRLVKGAYWDFETIHAEQMGWPSPVWGEKWQTDACFESMTQVLLDAAPGARSKGGVKLALGSHNARSIAVALAGLEKRGLPSEAIELQMLHGMADELKGAARELGLRVREYVPVGEMIPGMAYLVRRLLENTSNESWLRAGFLDNADARALLANPAMDRGRPRTPAKPDLASIAAERHTLSPAVEGVGDGRPFYTEPLRDFSRAAQRDAFAASIARASVPRVASDTTPQAAAAMVETAHAAFLGDGGGARGAGWRDVDARRRAAVLVRAASIMRARRDELAGVMIKESGKVWREADADVCEAIDFCEFYARLAVGLAARRRLGRFIGELDEVWYQPRGVAVVISPWNFPLAICTGMTVAALVTGNTVIVKPAEQTAGIASIMHRILQEALVAEGVPAKDAARVLQFCPAPGETTGAALVRDPRVAVIAFTGSKAVGLDIIRAAGETPAGQHHVKKVVCEMGGKNAAIVDISADLDEAVVGLRQSAFGFQGQKCSACSRIIVVDPTGAEGTHTATFIERFVNATRSLVVGDPTRPGTDVGPVIDAESAAKIRGYIERARAAGARAELADDGRAGPASADPAVIPTDYIAPTIFSRVRPDHELARDEIFGPVVAIMHARTFDEALAIANDHPYKLTGGVFTRKPSHIERAKREFRVGNLYINRGITGALVGRQPFGGFGMSGVGSKAGGDDYLLQFVEPRASCENTMRRGFAPEL